MKIYLTKIENDNIKYIKINLSQMVNQTMNSIHQFIFLKNI